MPKFRTIPIIVDARQLTEDILIANKGDWIVVDPDGKTKYYTDEVFRQTFEPADTHASLMLFGEQPDCGLSILQDNDGNTLVYKDGKLVGSQA